MDDVLSEVQRDDNTRGLEAEATALLAGASGRAESSARPFDPEAQRGDEPGLDDLASIELLHAEEDAKSIFSASQLKGGSYFTDPASFTGAARESNNGRGYVSFFGRVKGRGGEGPIRFSASWEQQLNDKGLPDTITKNYARLVKAYTVIIGSSPKKVQDLIDLVTNHRLGVRLGQGDEENIVFNIFVPREGA